MKRLYSALQLVEYCTHILPGIVASRPSGNRAEWSPRGKSRQITIFAPGGLSPCYL